MTDQKREYEDTLSVGKVLKDEFFSNDLTTRLREDAHHLRDLYVGNINRQGRWHERAALLDKAAGELDDAQESLKDALFSKACLKVRADALAEILKQARTSIENAPESAFGMGDGPDYQYPLKSELLTNIDAALVTYQGGK